MSWGHMIMFVIANFTNSLDNLFIIRGNAVKRSWQRRPHKLRAINIFFFYTYTYLYQYLLFLLIYCAVHIQYSTKYHYLLSSLMHCSSWVVQVCIKLIFLEIRCYSWIRKYITYLQSIILLIRYIGFYIWKCMSIIYKCRNKICQWYFWKTTNECCNWNNKWIISLVFKVFII